VRRHLDDGNQVQEGAAVSTSVLPSRGHKPSQHINRRQATNIIAAFNFAVEMGLPLNVSVDISWVFFSGTTDDRTRFARSQQRLSKWAIRRGFPLTMIWVREVGKNGGVHTHVLIHVPPPFMQDGTFQLTLERSFEPDGSPLHHKAILIQPAYHPRGKLLYNLKGVDPKHAAKFGIRPADQGELSGKRAGFTQNLGLARRNSTTRDVARSASYSVDRALSASTANEKSGIFAVEGEAQRPSLSRAAGSEQ
jgi:hypothetical protein